MRKMIHSILMKLTMALVAILMVAPGLTAQVSNSESTGTSNQILAFQNQMPDKDSDAYASLQKMINLDLHNVTLEEALNSVADQTGLKLMYRKALLQEGKKISYDNRSLTVYEALWEILDETGLQFAISNNRQLVLLRSRSSFRSELEANSITQKQIGSITGRVTDAMTGEPLFGANILVEDTSIGTATNIDGEYTLQRLPAGEHILIVRYLGYVTRNIEVSIVAGETLERDITLELDQVEGEEVIVGAQALGQALAIRQQLSSNTIVNVVSESRLREMADANAAESVGRLPGVSIVRDGGEAQNVSIRGMSSRYNNITVGGDRIPSTDLDGRSVALNFISQEMLSGIELYKSNRPDMDADAIGGTVNFSLARIPESTNLRVNVKGGYSGQINSFSNSGGSVSGSSRFFNDNLGFAASLDFSRTDRSSDELLNSYTTIRPAREGEPHAPLEIMNMSVIDRSEIRDRFGGSLLMDYKLDNGTIFLTTFGSRMDRDGFENERSLNLEANRQRWYFREEASKVDVLSNRLSGEHTLSNLGSTFIEWRVSHSVSSRRIPFNHIAHFEELSAFSENLDRRGDVRDVADFAKNDFRDTQLWRSNVRNIKSKERDFTGQLDISIPYQLTDKLLGKFKIGGKRLIKFRERVNEDLALFAINHPVSTMMDEAGRDLTTTSGGFISMLNYTDDNFQRENLFFGNFGFPIGLNRKIVNSIPVDHENRYVEALTAPMNNQNGNERISSAYVMTELNIGSRLMFMPGVRYEHTDGTYDAVKGSASGTSDDVGTVSDTTATRSFDQWFPMFQVRYAMTDWFTIRAAYTKSSSRPNYAEVTPRQRTNPQSLFIDRGNPNLRPSRSTNYDLFFSFYTNRLGLVTVGGFYKDIEDLIFTRSRRILGDYEELGLRETENNYELTEPLNNPLPTTVRGAEIEWQSNFTFLPSPFNGIVINANLTLMDSETQYPRSTLVRGPDGLARVDTFRVGPMPQQPDYIANASFGYDYSGFSFRITMLSQGKQLFLIGLRPEEDAMTQNILRWDAVIRQQLFIDGLSMYVNLHNITNEPDGANLFNDAFPTRSQFFGRAFDIGVRMNF